MKKRFLRAAVFIVMQLVVLSGCADKKIPDSPDKKKGVMQAVAIEPVQRSSIAKTLKLTGVVEPVRTARLASPVEGPVQVLWVREGDTVKSGAILFEIGRKSAVNAQLVAAREYLQSRKLELERVRKLVNEGAVPEAELDAAGTQYENARAQHARASENSGDFRIRAPWRGIISEVLIEEGDFVIPREKVLHMYDPKSLIIKSSVPETRAHQIKKDSPVKLKFDAYPESVFSGSVSRLYPGLDPKTRTRTFEVTIDDTVTLIPEMFARLEVEIARAENALVVPENAVVTTPKGKQVVYIVEKEIVSVRPVVTGIQTGIKVQVLSGLSDNEMVVVTGNEKIKDGSKVRITNRMKNNNGIYDMKRISIENKKNSKDEVPGNNEIRQKEPGRKK